MRPLPRAVLALLAGLLLGFRLPITPIDLLVTGALAAPFVFLLCSRALRVDAVVVASGALLGLATTHAARADCRAHLPDGAAMEVRGTFVEIPADRAAGFLLTAVSVDGDAVACRGAVRVRIGTRVDAPAPGAGVVGWGRWRAWPSDGPWPRRPEYSGTLVLDSVRVVAPPNPLRHPLLVIRGSAQARIRTLFDAHAPLVEALLIARTRGLDPEVRDRFARSGLAHLLSISGMHVGLIAGILLLVCRATGLSVRHGNIATVAATGAYVLLLGAPHAAARAAMQLGLVLAARMMQRPSDPYAILATAALVLLVADPMAALDAGFQLSFAGMVGLIALRRRLLDAIPGRRLHAIRDSIASSIAATIATAPFTVLHFNQVALIGVVSNLLAVPLLALAVPALGLALAIGIVSEAAGRFLAGGAGLVLDALDAVAGVAAEVPMGSLRVPSDAVVAWTLGAIAWALATAYLARRNPPPRSTPGRPTGIRPAVRTIAGAIVFLVLVTAWPLAANRFANGLEIHAIDVGQGDALAIRTPKGRWLLVDTGPRSDRFDAGRATVVPFLLRHGARRLEALVLTHPDADHIGGAEAVLDAFPVGTIVDPGLAVGKAMYLNVLRASVDEGARWIAARAGQRIVFDGLEIELLHPSEDWLDDDEDANNVSVAFRLRYGHFAALFLGDLPAAAEIEIAARHGEQLRSQLLKVGHHGSATSTATALLEAARPEAAVISVGKGNRYGHPAPVVLERLESYGVRVLRTDLHGAIGIRAWMDGRYTVETAR